MTAHHPEMDEEPRRDKAAHLPDDDVAILLVEQHARIKAADGDRAKDVFNALQRPTLYVDITATPPLICALCVGSALMGAQPSPLRAPGDRHHSRLGDVALMR
jgi:hypothetical protein